MLNHRYDSVDSEWNVLLIFVFYVNENYINAPGHREWSLNILNAFFFKEFPIFVSPAQKVTRIIAQYFVCVLCLVAMVPPNAVTKEHFITV